MVEQLVYRPPYAAVRLLGAWAEYRYRYLRGRLLLSGVRIETLSLSDLVDVAHAAMVEPLASGSWVTLDAILDDLEKAIIEAEPNRETFGTSAVDLRAARSAEKLFAAARPKEPPSTVAPE